MAQVVKASRALGMEAPILATSQHRDLLDQMLATFAISPDWDLDAMHPDQTLASLTGSLIPDLDRVIRENHPQAVLAQGDTTTVFCSALAAFYAQVPFGHVEAGLRSGDLTAPFPVVRDATPDGHPHPLAFRTYRHGPGNAPALGPSRQHHPCGRQHRHRCAPGHGRRSHRRNPRRRSGRDWSSP